MDSSSASVRPYGPQRRSILGGRAPPTRDLSDDFQWIDARSTHDKLGLRFIQELSLESRHIPLMQLASVAELMRYDYDVELNHDQLDHRSVDLLVGSRHARPELPVAIRLGTYRSRG